MKGQSKEKAAGCHCSGQCEADIKAETETMLGEIVKHGQPGPGHPWFAKPY